MNPAERNRYRKILESKKADLSSTLKKRDGLEVAAEADTFDEAQRLSERELVIRQLDRESLLLRDVRAALARLTDCTYGVCLHCEEEISPRRLAAVPWAPLCLRCQEQADAEAREEDEGPLSGMAPAA